MAVFMEILFVTSNRYKFKEGETILKEKGIKLVHDAMSCPEIQSDSLLEIATDSARYAYDKMRKPLIVEDSGLFVYDLKGFPGPYSRYTLDTIGCKGILKLMEGKANRAAEFRSVIAYATPNSPDIKTFVGRVDGNLSEAIRGDDGFGYDPIFIPFGKQKTFAEDYAYKMKVSHRIKSFQLLAEHLTKL